MGNKVAYRLPSISLLSLDFPLPAYPNTQPSASRTQPYYVTPQASAPGMVLPGTNALPGAITPAYAYSEPVHSQTMNSPYDGSMSSGSGRGSPSAQVIPKILTSSVQRVNDIPLEHGSAKPIIPSIASFTSGPSVLNSSSTVLSPPTYQYVQPLPRWIRHSSEQLISYNSSKVLSPPLLPTLSAGPAVPEILNVVPKEAMEAAGQILTSYEETGARVDAGDPTSSSRAQNRVLKPGESLKRKKRECPECHLFFSNLATHKSTHLNPTARPHVCKICGRGFSRPNDLFRHFKCHWKKIGADGGQFKCPFKNGPRGSHCCHLLGIFSRCDTYKNHLKAIHFQYPGGTRKSERNLVPGCCRLCKKEFRNVDEWYNTHVDTGECAFINDK